MTIKSFNKYLNSCEFNLWQCLILYVIKTDQRKHRWWWTCIIIINVKTFGLNSLRRGCRPPERRRPRQWCCPGPSTTPRCWQLRCRGQSKKQRCYACARSRKKLGRCGWTTLRRGGWKMSRRRGSTAEWLGKTGRRIPIFKNIFWIDVLQLLTTDW